MAFFQRNRPPRAESESAKSESAESESAADAATPPLEPPHEVPTKGAQSIATRSIAAFSESSVDNIASMQQIIGPPWPHNGAVRDANYAAPRFADSATISVPIAHLMPNPGHPREISEEPDEDLRSLATTLATDGQQEPLHVTPYHLKTLAGAQDQSFLVIDGHRRLKAAQLAGLRHLLVHVHVSTSGDMLDGYAALTFWLRHTLTHKNLSGSEVITAILQLRRQYEHTCAMNGSAEPFPSQHDLAKRLGVAPGTINRAMKIAGQPEVVREAVLSKAMQADVVLKLLTQGVRDEALVETVAAIQEENARRQRRGQPRMEVAEAITFIQPPVHATKLDSEMSEQRIAPNMPANASEGADGERASQPPWRLHEEHETRSTPCATIHLRQTHPNPGPHQLLVAMLYDLPRLSSRREVSNMLPLPKPMRKLLGVLKKPQVLAASKALLQEALPDLYEAIHMPASSSGDDE